MSKSEKKARKNSVLGRSSVTPETEALLDAAFAPKVKAPVPDVPSSPVLDSSPPAPDAVVVPPVVTTPAPPAKVKVPFVYNRDQVNALIAAEREQGVVRIHPDKSRYVKAVASSADARTVLDNADQVAVALRSVDLADLWIEAAKHLSHAVIIAKKAKYAGKNAGMVRMNVGNLIRGAIRAKERAANLAAQADKAAQPSA